MSETHTMFEKMTAPFAQMFSEQSSYASAMRDEMTSMRERNMHLMKSSMEDLATLTRASMSYQTELMGELQKISADAMKSSMSWMTPGDK